MSKRLTKPSYVGNVVVSGDCVIAS